MATLKEIEERQEVIRAELARIEDNPGATEETDGDMVDTLVAEFESLERRRQPLAERASKLNLIRFKAGDPANLEGPDVTDDGYEATRRRGAPDIVLRTKRDPLEGIDEIRRNDPKLQTIPRQEIRDRGMWLVERSNKMGALDDAKAETVQERINGDWNQGIARHCLLTGSDEYLETYRAYLSNPEANAARAALSLTNANGGFLLPYVLDQMVA